VLVTLKPGHRAEDFAGFLAWLRSGNQLIDFQKVDGADAFLVSGREGLGMIAAQPQVAELGVAAPDKLQAARAEKQQRLAQQAARLTALAPASVQAYTPTTPTVDIGIYNSSVSGDNATYGIPVYVTVTKAIDGIK
jgi:hypothetical protein